KPPSMAVSPNALCLRSASSRAPNIVLPPPFSLSFKQLTSNSEEHFPDGRNSGVGPDAHHQLPIKAAHNALRWDKNCRSSLIDQ
ncbi:hypothetical protein, partial [Serratia marcescens]|uniref:hypothetical protein n=1 Tax=Serratia marcescens TaxID=615 RepID=UPI001955438F